MSVGHPLQSTLSTVDENEEHVHETFADFSLHIGRDVSNTDSLGEVAKERTARTESGDPDNENQNIPPEPVNVGDEIGAAPTRSTTRYEKLAQKKPKVMDYPSITLSGPVIVFFDIVVPCIIYYSWYDIHRSRCQIYPGSCPVQEPDFNKDILGYSIISFGFGELWILIARVIRLLKYRDECAPLLSRSKWELDATCWVYGVAMLIALVPFVVGSKMVIPKLYLYGPAFLMGFLGVLMLVTLLPLPIPIGINSHPRGTSLRPFIYYAAEDFIAVDCLQDREFRVRYNERYETSKGFRRLFVHLTLWWLCGVCVYIGCLSAVIWTLEFHHAFGLSLGILFSYILSWAAISYFWVQAEMARERKAFERSSKC